MHALRSLPFCRLTTCLVIAVAWSACSDSSDGGNDATLDENSFGQKFRFLDNEVPDWTQAEGDSAYSVWTAENLADKIAGAASDYTTRGCQFAMYQALVGPPPETCEVVAMDFGTDAQATSMFAFEKETTAASAAIPRYDTGIAIGSAKPTGMTVYAHFGRNYFELRLDGYSDQDSAIQAALPFLQVLEQKSK